MLIKRILSSDIGGTNSRFALFEIAPDGHPTLVEIQWLKTTESSSFNNLLTNLKESGFTFHPDKIDIVVFAVAGPVEEGVRSSPPFISWDVDISNLEKDFGFKRCMLINDFVAQAYACLSPAGKSSRQVLTGQPSPDGTKAVIGAGTGLGKAVLVPDGKGGYIVMPSEGGHANFPFVSGKEFELHDFMKDKLGDRYITANKVVSGEGLRLVNWFLSGDKMEPAEVAAKFSQYPETLEWVSRFYARVCRNFALETLSTGGLYIAGGIAANTPELVTGNFFADEFRSSDTLAELLDKIPVFLITDQNSGLLGSAVLGAQKLREK